MYAIVEIAGQQFKVEKSQKIFVHRLANDEGAKVDFDQVLLVDNDKNVVVGEPVVNGALVRAKVLSHLKGDKVVVFKKKRRKGYKVKNGHRQSFTQVEIEDILEKGGSKKATAKKAEKPIIEKTEEVAKEKKDTPKAAAKPKAKAAAKPKATTKTEDKPKATAKPKAETKTKTAAKSKTVAKPKAAAKPKAKTTKKED